MYFPASLSFPVEGLAVAPTGPPFAVVAFGFLAKECACLDLRVGAQGATRLANTVRVLAIRSGRRNGRTVAFFADGKLKKVEVSGGAVQQNLRRTRGRDATWKRTA